MQCIFQAYLTVPLHYDAVWLGTKGNYGLFHFWINIWVTSTNATIIDNKLNDDDNNSLKD